MMDTMRTQMGMVLSTTIVRLVVAAILGGLIGLERQLRRKPAGLRTNMFICFGAAMFTVEGPREDQDEINLLLHQSTVFSSVGTLDSIERE